MSRINPPNAAIVDAAFRPTPEFYRFLVAIQKDVSGVSLSVDDAALFTSGASGPPTDAQSDDAGLLVPVAAFDTLSDVIPPVSVERIDLDSATGLIEQTGFDSFTKRAVGVAASTDIPTRADADARYMGIGGALSLAARTITATGSVNATDYLILCDATAGAITVNLPAAASSAGRVLVVKKIDASVNVVTLDGSGAETIDGAATKTLLTQYAVLNIQCDGANWWII